MGDTADLEKLLEDIRLKTGREVYLSPRRTAETRFTAEWNGRPTDFYIEGEGEAQEREATLLRYLISSADGNRPSEKRGGLKSVLLGEGGSWTTFRFLARFNIADAPCYALDVVPDKRPSEALQHVLGCLGEADMALDMDEAHIAVVKFAEEGQTAFEFGDFLCRSLYEETGIRASVGVGCEMPSFSEIALSYSQAATAVRMSAIMQARGDVHSYREYLLVRMLEDVPKSRLSEYLEQFRLEGLEEVLGDEDMVSTAEEFLENSLNLSETSRKLFMHRNTLMYRLDKIERATGLNIRKFSDAATFRVITVLYKLLQS